VYITRSFVILLFTNHYYVEDLKHNEIRRPYNKHVDYWGIPKKKKIWSGILREMSRCWLNTNIKRNLEETAVNISNAWGYKVIRTYENRVLLRVMNLRISWCCERPLNAEELECIGVSLCPFINAVRYVFGFHITCTSSLKGSTAEARESNVVHFRRSRLYYTGFTYFNNIFKAIDCNTRNVIQFYIWSLLCFSTFTINNIITANIFHFSTSY
jgi:hypothetical protein